MKDIKTQEDLVWLIDNEVEESTILEFKSKLPKKSPSERDNSKRILSKAVSALANTNGGQLIIGLKEVNDIASEINWIEEKKFRQTLDNWINSELEPVITNYEIKTIRNKQNDKQNVFVIKIEKSRKAPHRARDGAYYKRVECYV
ncbi:MAG: ATP-binding protein [Candidatus Heimdallarchaeota archaeon]|nr:ATP-binding protein [Candidatus Heimdallarchaeota archaeon]